MRSRSLITMSLLAVAAVGGVAVWQLQPEAPPPPPAPTRSDYILENFELTSLGEDGKESFSVTAPRLERNEK